MISAAHRKCSLINPLQPLCRLQDGNIVSDEPHAVIQGSPRRSDAGLTRCIFHENEPHRRPSLSTRAMGDVERWFAKNADSMRQCCVRQVRDCRAFTLRVNKPPRDRLIGS